MPMKQPSYDTPFAQDSAFAPPQAAHAPHAHASHFHAPRRRLLLAGAGMVAAGPFITVLAQTNELPEIPALADYLAGRRVQFNRLLMDVPRVADNGNSVPIKLGVLGATAPGAVRSIHLFSERNPVPQMAVFRFAPDSNRFDIESRVRMAGTQRLVALATLADGTLLVKVAEVLVAIAACLDGS
jgi:sulfur-oxidizing protein SoxY